MIERGLPGHAHISTSAPVPVPLVLARNRKAETGLLLPLGLMNSTEVFSKNSVPLLRPPATPPSRARHPPVMEPKPKNFISKMWLGYMAFLGAISSLSAVLHHYPLPCP